MVCVANSLDTVNSYPMTTTVNIPITAARSALQSKPLTNLR